MVGLETKTNFYGFFVGIYELYQGKHNLVNPDVFAKNKYVFEDFKPHFISPIALIVDQEAVKDNTAALHKVPAHLFYDEAKREKELYQLQIKYQRAIAEIENRQKTQKAIDKETKKIQELFMKDKVALERQLENAKRNLELSLKEQEMKLFKLQEELAEKDIKIRA